MRGYNTGMSALQEFRERLRRDTVALDSAGLLKREKVIGGAQGPVVRLADGRELINLCANNYLGLANHPTVIAAAHDALARYGYGVASVRFICGTQSVHRELEDRLSAYLSMEDTILYSSCFDANGGLFETLLDEKDAVISDSLNPPVQGAAPALRQQRSGRARNGAQGLEGREGAADRHRRRLLDGRLDREARRDLRPGRSPWSAGHGR
jgi:glycine C-acetyltransferase